MLGPGNIIGLYGVYTFFIISGFLLSHSLDRDASAVRFAINRTLRIYPGFIFCVLVTALVLGPMGSSLPLRQYLASPDVPGYVTTAVSCLCDSTLPGVYRYAGTDLHLAVNGSLWSLSFEVLSYLLLASLWLAVRNITVVGILLALFAASTLAFGVVYHGVRGISFTLPYFAGGVLMYAIQQRIGLKWSVALCCMLGLVVFAAFELPQKAYAVFGAYLVVFFGSRPNVLSSIAARVGDLSYGVYLFGWPVEQLIKVYTGTASPWLLMALACPIVLLLAAVSYHAVERPALRLKRPASRFVEGAVATHDAAKQRAAHFGAALTLCVVATAILVSGTRSWFVTRSVGEAVLWSGLGAMVAVVGTAFRRSWQRRRNV